MKINAILFLLVATTSLQAQNAKKAAQPDGIFAEMETNKGKIVLQLEYQKTPITVANFVSLAEGTNPFVNVEKLKNKPFFDGLKFHRVIKDFMIQGGDPLGNGSGDPGYKFKDEITDLKHDRGGILSMANSGPATNGSQFFITHKATPWLDGKHTVYGHVVSGMETVNAIQQDDVILQVKITRRGKDAKNFDAAKVFSNYYANKAEDDKKQAALEAENRRKQAEADAESKRLLEEKIAPVKKAKAAYFDQLRTTAKETASGLKYKIISNGTGLKPAAGTPIFIHYAGYFPDGGLFDSSYDDVNRAYFRFDERRAAQNGYQPFPFTAGQKQGLIAGFIEAIEQMSVGDKLVAFIPSILGYGASGHSGVIPPNADIIFEIELFDKMPAPKK
ncbi:MAG: peptidylprolyl isomerase [Flavobacterium sp.]|nr:peptidylprolyl isomerase [Flavobacterium sp.]